MMILRPQTETPEVLEDSGAKNIVDLPADGNYFGTVAGKIKAAIVALALNGWLSYPLANWLVSFLRLREA